jgi:hypothetical protein
MRALILAAVLLPAAALAQEAWEAFTDKGSIFVRAGSQQGLKVGTELSMFKDANDATPAGKATVMEVFDAMARINLDGASTAARAKYARIPGTGPALAGAELKGRASMNVIGRLTIYNDTSANWTDCVLTLPDGKIYKESGVNAHSDDGIMVLKFVSPPGPQLDHVRVKCAEGDAKFVFKDPSAKTALKGYAENSDGRITLHNTGTTGWTQCTVSKPDGTFYVMGELKADDHDSIAASRFKKEDVPYTTVQVQCRQGLGIFKIER